MEATTSAISVQVDAYDKEIANSILKNLGLNMSTFVNLAIKQLIYTFEVKNPKPNTEILEALKEGEYHSCSECHIEPYWLLVYKI